MNGCGKQCLCVQPSKSRCLSYKGLLGAFVVAVFISGLLLALNSSVFAETTDGKEPFVEEKVATDSYNAEEDTITSLPPLPKVDCYTTREVAREVGVGRCLVIFDGGVYNVTEGNKWSPEGHVGQHACGGVYISDTIEQGPHLAEVMKQFYVAPICGEEETAMEVSPIRGEREIADGEVGQSDSEVLRRWSKRPFGLNGWRVFFAYLSGIFFILNFATCYAMPWARHGAPWAGEKPGEDDKDQIGHFPLTHWHPWFAWGSVLFLGLHGILGFLCSWGVACL